MEDDTIRKVSSPPPYKITMIYSQFLAGKSRYPDARRATSCLQIDWEDPEHAARMSRLILLACMREPGAMVAGATQFIAGDHEDEAVEFLCAAGFTREDAERIAVPGWSYQFSTKFITRYEETTPKLPDNAPESEIDSSGPRDHEVPIQGCGAFY